MVAKCGSKLLSYLIWPQEIILALPIDQISNPSKFYGSHLGLSNVACQTQSHLLLFQNVKSNKRSCFLMVICIFHATKGVIGSRREHRGNRKTNGVGNGMMISNYRAFHPSKTLYVSNKKKGIAHCL